MLNRKKAYSFFSSNFSIHKSTNDWYLMDCPLCNGKQKGAVNFMYERFKCFRCENRMGIIAFVGQLEGLDYRDAKKLIHSYDESYLSFDTMEVSSRGKVEINRLLPKQYRGIMDGDTALAVRARNYLSRRGLVLEELDADGWGYSNKHGEDFNSDYFGYIIIPFKRFGKLYYFQTRGFLGQDRRYKNPSVEEFGIGKAELLYNQDALVLERRVFLTEGVFDAKTIGNQGVCILGKSLSSKQFEIIVKSPVEEVVIALDEGCRKEAEAIAMMLIDYKKVKILDLVGGDPNELGREEVFRIYDKTDYIEFIDLL